VAHRGRGGDGQRLVHVAHYGVRRAAQLDDLRLLQLHGWDLRRRGGHLRRTVRGGRDPRGPRLRSGGGGWFLVCLGRGVGDGLGFRRGVGGGRAVGGRRWLGGRGGRGLCLARVPVGGRGRFGLRSGLGRARGLVGSAVRRGRRGAGGELLRPAGVDARGIFLPLLMECVHEPLIGTELRVLRVL